MNNKVGEHITLDFHGVHEDHKPEFYEKIFKKIAQAAKVEICLLYTSDAADES